nr:alpha/beta hydrolase [Kibdelosporangium sp. MJ126-NF4]CEL21910.1 Putative lipase [Kibdelosporangium sp. MJ126-NF4]CTQ92690.1 Putative lipase [Kibdelosporangium sp. MJ126-NF4]
MRTTLTVVLTTAALSGLVGGSASAGTPADQRPTLALAAPTGPFPVGRATRHVVDYQRPDPWVANRRRELMLTVWYPAARPAGPVAKYTTAKESEILVRQFSPELPADLLATLPTHARTNAPARTAPGGLPLVLLSPGWQLPRSSQTGLAEEFASRGYVVAAIDHTYESTAVEFPDGRVTTCAACEQLAALPPAEHEAFFVRVSTGRAADVSFVIDALKRGFPAVDGKRVAMVGHSIGGSATVAAMAADRRIAAGVNMDGRLSPPLTRQLARPVLFFGEQRSVPGGAIEWDASYRQLTGWRRWLSVRGMGHESFSDLGLLGEQLGMPMQDMPGRRSVDVQRAYLTAFLDQHLRGRAQPILDGPSNDFAEVTFQ